MTGPLGSPHSFQPILIPFISTPNWRDERMIDGQSLTSVRNGSLHVMCETSEVDPPRTSVIETLMV